MPMVFELREQSYEYRDMARKETMPALKRHLASHALALAELAEKIAHGRDAAARPAASLAPSAL